MSNFIQSTSWEKFQAALGEKTVRESGKGWSYWGRLVPDNLGKYLYLPYGPVVEDEAALDAALESASAKAKELGAYRLVAEPSLPITKEQAASRFTRQLHGFQPSRTLVIDLTQSTEDIIKGMSTTRRKQHRSAERKGLSFRKSTTREEYDRGVEYLKLTGETKSFIVQQDKYFDSFWEHLVEPGIATIYAGLENDELRVVGMVVDDEDTRYYLYVGRDLSNNSLQISAPFITHMILDAKEKGLKHFDLFGISESDDVEDEMTGFTVFKRTFGGETKQFAGTWEVGIKKTRYTLRRILDGVRK